LLRKIINNLGKFVKMVDKRVKIVYNVLVASKSYPLFTLTK